MLTLGLGLGGAAAVGALAESLLRPMPFPEADRLVVASEVRDGRVSSVAPANYLDWRQSASSFTGLAAQDTRSVSLTVDGVATRGDVANVSGNFFEVLGVEAVLGRTFDPSFDSAFPRREAVLSHSTWTDSFGADRRALGHTLQVEDVTYTVVGVAAPGLEFPASGLSAWLRTPTEAPEIAGFPGDLTELRDAWYFQVFGRLADEVDLPAAQAEMSVIGSRLALLHPDTNESSGVALVPLLEETIAGFGSTLLALTIAVGLVLLAAVTNVTHLVFARSAARVGENSVRIALGAGRASLLRQSLAEGLLIGLGGGLLGIALARLGIEAGTATLGPWVPRASELAMRPTTIGLVIVLGALVGMGVTAVTQTRTSLRPAALRSRQPHRRPGFARHGLITAQVAAAVALIAGAGLLARSVQQLSAVDLGFADGSVVTLRVALPDARARAYEERLAVYDRLRDAVASVPGVEAVGYGTSSPLSQGIQAGLLFAEQPGDRNPPSVGWQPVTPSFFEALGIPVRRGRSFNSGDRPGSVEVGVVNEALARSVFGGEDPIGRQVTIGLDGHDRPITIVGIVGDTRTRGPALPPAAVLYRPIAQTDRHSATTAFFAANVSSADAIVLAKVRDALRTADASLPVYDEALGTEMARPFRRTQASLLSVLGMFALTAVLLGAVGVYGVTSYAVRQSRHEIGVRIALGATRKDVMRHFVLRGLLRASTGVPVGLGLTLLLGNALGTVLVDVPPADPVILGLGSLLVLGVTAVALFLPARSAAGTDPATVTKSV